MACVDIGMLCGLVRIWSGARTEMTEGQIFLGLRLCSWIIHQDIGRLPWCFRMT